MDPTNLRPRDSRPVVDDRTDDRNESISYERLFAARTNDLLEARQNIFREILLAELYRLRSSIAAATSVSPSVQHNHSYTLAEATLPTDHLCGETHDIVASTTNVTGESFSGDKASMQNIGHDSESISLSNRLSEDSTPERRNSATIETSPKTPLTQPGLSDGSLQMHISLVEKSRPKNVSVSSAMSHQASQSHYPSCEIDVKRFLALSHVVKFYRCFTEMSKAYPSRQSPSYSVTYSTGEFPTSGLQDQLVSNQGSNILTTTRSIATSPESLPSLPSTSNMRFPNIRSFRRSRYIPPLLARLYFEHELLLLFNSHYGYTYSSAKLSLTRAFDSYYQKLFPSRPASSVSRPGLRSSRCEPSQASNPNIPALRREEKLKSAAKSLSPFPTLPKATLLLHSAKAFQRRTFYCTTQRTKLHAPSAAWRDDKTRGDNSLSLARPARSHSAYAPSTDIRGHSYHLTLDGVHSGPDDTSVTLAFGFQRQTNYPFRKTYGQPRTMETVSSPPKTPLRVSEEFASRVPVRGLSSTLLHLFQPDVPRGLFFNAELDDQTTGLERRNTEILYSINAEGKLVQLRIT